MFADLYVVTALSNPERWRSRYRLYKDFEKHCNDAGAILYTVEAAFGERPHEVTSVDNPQHIQLRTASQLWHKENLLNIGISRLPHDWQYVAWIDCDVLFARPDWVEETIQQLQHFSVVQMFSHLTDLGPSFTPAPSFYAHKPMSFGYCHVNQPNIGLNSKHVYDMPLHGAEPENYYRHPGFAWAARREAFDALGGLIDWGIVGGADYLMALCLTGANISGARVGSGAMPLLEEWKARCDQHIKKNVGYVPGLILHNWHGKKSQRSYKNRSQILIDNGYNPELDIKRDWQGLWQLTDRNPKLRDDIRNFARSRNEDSIDVD